METPLPEDSSFFLRDYNYQSSSWMLSPATSLQSYLLARLHQQHLNKIFFYQFFPLHRQPLWSLYGLSYWTKCKISLFLLRLTDFFLREIIIRWLQFHSCSIYLKKWKKIFEVFDISARSFLKKRRNIFLKLLYKAIFGYLSQECYFYSSRNVDWLVMTGDQSKR
jgi:hypothetical protein